MKRLSLLLIATLLAVVAPVQSARAEAEVSIDFFFDALSPQGDWIYAQDYGYVWQPAVAQQEDWAPYTDGYWAYTDAGWTWISNEDFGWATYHYGRWLRMEGSWVWVPGYEWAPSWVSWRQTDDHIGWAPLPPEASWSANVGFNEWTDTDYDIGPSYYNFVPFLSFATRSSLRPFIVDRSRNVSYIDRSVNVTSISYRQNVVNNIFAGGPDPDRFNHGDHHIRRLSLRRDDDSFRRDWLENRGERPRGFGSLSRIERDDLIVAAPSIRRDDSPRLPSRVRERFDRPDIDRGWKGLGDPQAAERLRERQRTEFAKANPGERPDRKPSVATSLIPPPAVGRVLKLNERRGSSQRPDPSRVEEEIRRGGVPPTATDRPGSSRPGMRDDPPSSNDPRRPGSPDREGRPGTPDRDGRPDMRPDGRPGIGPDGRPDLRPDGRPGRGPDGVPDMKPDGRPDVRPGSRPGERPGSPSDRPGMRPDGRPDGVRPEGTPGSPDRRPGVKPGEAPRPRLAPGVVPNDDDKGRRGGAPSMPGKPKTEDAPPAPKDAPKPVTPPKVTPDLPRVNPNLPGNRDGRPDRSPGDRPGRPESRPGGAPEGRRPGSALPGAPARPTPMPEARPESKARPSPMPKPEIPKTRPVPMPKPESRPAPEKAAPERRSQAPEIRSSKPSAPQVKAPSARPASQVKRPEAPSRPKVQQAPPQVKREAPKARPAPAKVAAPKAPPTARPTPAKKPAAAKKKPEAKD